MPKKLILCLVCICCMLLAKAQYYNAVNYSNGTAPSNGVKIKTNLPFASSHMPTVILEGYNYGTRQPIGLMLTFYVFNGAFTNMKVSSFGAYTPPVWLGAEDGKVVIFINNKIYFQRFQLRVGVSGTLAGETAANCTNWTVVDETLSGATAVVQVQYENVFSGHVGIGSGDPLAPLHVAGATIINDQPVSAILGATWNHWTHFGGISGGRIRGSNEGYLDIETNPTGTDKRLYLNSSSSGNIIMAVGGGNVAIGRPNPGEYKLAVKGTIGAQKVKVTQTGWADFVFEADYKMMTLAEIESFIKTNKHLPEIPSAAEVEKDGLDLGEINKKLLQKIEELTLHLIEENKKNTEQAAQILELKKDMELLKTRTR